MPVFWFRESFVNLLVIGESCGGRRLCAVTVGEGKRKVLLSACHHANEWLTGLCLWYAMEDYCRAIAAGEFWAASAFAETTVCAVPWVNPDGAALVMGLSPEGERDAARRIGSRFPQIPFPEGWKANLRGVDLNLNYPADWETVRERKFKEPAPRDYPGENPFSERETCALAALTEGFSPDVVAALHSQGEELYLNFGRKLPQGSRALGARLSNALGYPVLYTPADADGGGYKDWFIETYEKPGVTAELGLGENPLPLAALPGLMEKTRRLLRVLTEDS